MAVCGQLTLLCRKTTARKDWLTGYKLHTSLCKQQKQLPAPVQQNTTLAWSGLSGTKTMV